MESVALSALVSSLVGAIVSSVVAFIKLQGQRVSERTDAEKAADEAMRAGLRALLWRELKTIHEQAMNQGGLDVSDRKHLESVYATYHKLGGNGTGTRLYNDAMNQPVVD